MITVIVLLLTSFFIGLCFSLEESKQGKFLYAVLWLSWFTLALTPVAISVKNAI